MTSEILKIYRNYKFLCNRRKKFQIDKESGFYNISIKSWLRKNCSFIVYSNKFYCL